MAEKCNECATRCAADDELIYLLLESWGGISIYDKNVSSNRYPVLHLRLIAVLNERLKLNTKNHQDEKELDILIQSLFERESVRKKSAQARE